MYIPSLVNTPKIIVAAWQSLFGKPEIDRGHDPYERTPVRRNEISELLAQHYRKDDPRGYSKMERRDHDNLTAMRDILYPSDAA